MGKRASRRRAQLGATIPDGAGVQIVKSAGSAFVRAPEHDCDPLGRIVGILDHINQLQDELDREVLHGREHGLSWDALGAALGISRQAVTKRYSVADVVAESTGWHT